MLSTAYAAAHPEWAGDVLFCMARAALLLGDVQAEEKMAARLAQLGSSHKNVLAGAYAEFIRAGIHADAGEQREAISGATSASEQLEATHQPELQAIASAEMCDVSVRAGRHDLGAIRCEDARRRWTELGDRYQIGRAYSSLSLIMARDRGDFREAIRLGERAQEEFRREGLPSLVAMVDDNLAGDYLEIGQPRKALELSRRALSFEERSGSPSHAFASRMSIATALSRLGRHAEALDTIERAIGDAKAINYEAALEDLYVTQIEIARGAGKPDLALDAADDAREIVKKLSDARREAAIAAAETRYRALAKQREIDRLDHENRVKVLELETAQARLHRQKLGIVLGIVVIVSLVAISVLLLLLLRAVRRSEREFELLSRTDPLTETSNRRALMQILESVLSRLVHDGDAAALLVIDADHFKHINDTWGHQAGDAALKHLVGQVRGHIRANDTLGRLGGEEFGLVLPGLSADDAVARAETIRGAIAGSAASIGGASIPLTVSIGVAPAEPGRYATVDEWIGAGDRALYAAKGAGRNRVELAD